MEDILTTPFSHLCHFIQPMEIFFFFFHPYIVLCPGPDIQLHTVFRSCRLFTRKIENIKKNEFYKMFYGAAQTWSQIFTINNGKINIFPSIKECVHCERDFDKF